jgi:putative FmdB family regulatory protein
MVEALRLMPMYEYQCAACGHRLETIQKFSDKPLKSCPKCKKPKLERLLSSPAIQFKGTGWYITDYARKNSPDPSKAEKESKPAAAAESSSDGKASGKDSGKEAAKPAAKAESAKTSAKK